jgi:hypothetical protein
MSRIGHRIILAVRGCNLWKTMSAPPLKAITFAVRISICSAVLDIIRTAATFEVLKILKDNFVELIILVEMN